MMAYRNTENENDEFGKVKFLSRLGGAFAAFTPGCPACTAPLAVILGAIGGLITFSNARFGIKVRFSRSI